MTKLLRLTTASVMALSVATTAPLAPLAQTVAAPPEATQDVVINMRGANIQDVAEQVSRITGRTLVLDPQVQGQVNVVSAQPLSRNGVWELFLSVLRTSGYAAVRSGSIWRVVPQASVVQSGASETGAASSTQQVVTRLVRLRNLPSDQAVRALRPLVSSFGAIEALTEPNAVVVTDYAENIARVQQLAATLDRGGGASFDSIVLQHASAVDVAASVSQLLGSDAGGPRVTADERSNVILIRGDASDIAQARSIVAALDTPGGATPVVRVVRLRNSDAESITEVVRGLLGGEPSATNAVARSLRNDTGLAGLSASNRDTAAQAASAITSGGEGGASLPQPGAEATRARPASFTLDGVTVQASPELNAVVMRGPPATVQMLEDLIGELDLRRAQVKIEVAIVEITGELGEQIGVQLGFGGAVPATGATGGTSFGNAGSSLATVLTALGYPAGRLLSSGLSVAAGEDGEFGLLLQALGTNSAANLLSSPSVTVLDNEAAEIVVGQNVPFRTGSFATDGNSTNPFTTISREDVGLTLRVVPRVHEGETVRLEVSQEVSSLVTTAVTGAADLITNRRSIQTSVLADDGETIVLGGLVTDDRQTGNSRVPGLGNIPLIGNAFRSRNESQTRRTLFIFLKPTILRDAADVAASAQESYDRLRAAEPVRVDPARAPALQTQPRLVPDVDEVF